jgi:diguanylate cyclase (GGDEF)-like protein/PAS domain S-box-containing protein
MSLDPRTLAVAFVLLMAMLGVLLLFSWVYNRRIQALAWWGGSFCLLPIGIGMANLGQAVPSFLPLLTANALVVLGYGTLYAGCRTFNGRAGQWSAVAIGPAILLAVFPLVRETLSARLLLVSLIVGAYAAASAWELWKHAAYRLVFQRVAVVLLFGLSAFNIFRGLLGLKLLSIAWMDVFASRWSAELALLLVIYAPALAFVFLSMAKERIELDHKCAEQALRESEEHYRYSVELNPQIPWTADPQGHFLDMSPRLHALTGMRMGSVFEAEGAKTFHPEDVAPARQHWAHSLATGEPFDQELRLRLADGSCRWLRVRAAPRRDENGIIIRWYGTAEDIHDRKLAVEQLHWAAHHDDLTGFANRRLFLERLKQALSRAEKSGHIVGLLVMDLDHLKSINDRFGHDAGDALLQEFATRLCDIVRTTDTVARLGGDEFAIILTDVPGEEYVAATAKAILAQMQEPLRYNGRTLDCRASIGGTISAGPETTTEELQKQADLALYHCKTSGRGTFKMFRPAMREEAQKTTSALDVARKAVASNWIVPFYQPKVTLKSGALGGFEALLRWHHPRMGIQSPETIAPAFDDTELGTAIGNGMLSRVVSDMRSWLDAGLEFGRISINASAAEFRQDDYAERVLEYLRQAGVPTSYLGVEVTESVFLGSSTVLAERTLQTLSASGVSIALDDFGTGYASLTHLKRFPVNVIKIDRSFVSNLETDAGNAAIVRALLSLGQSLGIRVVAEGVETAAQTSFLRQHGCHLGQGYLFGRPMPAEGVPQFIAAWGQDRGPRLATSGSVQQS